MEKQVVVKNGISTGTLVFLVFLVLKLTNVIDWSWWWVTCPLWIGLAIFLGAAVVMLIIGILVSIFGR
jgi:xanthine/uracil permease